MFRHITQVNVKYVRNGKNGIVCGNQNKIFLPKKSVVRQVMQSANCAPARRLKNVLVDLLVMQLCIKKIVVNKKRILLSILHAIHHANELCADQAAKALK